MENNLNNLPKFYVGQKVIAIKTHKGGLIKIGDEFFITSVKKGCHVAFIVTVGIKDSDILGRCAVCKAILELNGEHPFDQDMFAPVKLIKLPLLTYTKVMEEVEVSSN